MNYLLDTCVISELLKPTPNPCVIHWMDTCLEEMLYLSVLTIGEIRKGITKLPDSSKKVTLQQWLEHDLHQRFAGRILEITETVAERWGEIQGIAEQQGRTMPVIDSLIAATGLVYRVTVVTRNTPDIARSGVQTLNPWEPPQPLEEEEERKMKKEENGKGRKGDEGSEE